MTQNSYQPDVVRSVRPEVPGPSDEVRSTNRETLMTLIEQAGSSGPDESQTGCEPSPVLIDLTTEPNVAEVVATPVRARVLAFAAAVLVVVGLGAIVGSGFVAGDGDSILSADSSRDLNDASLMPGDVFAIVAQRAAQQQPPPSDLPVYRELAVSLYDDSRTEFETWRRADGSGYSRTIFDSLKPEEASAAEETATEVSDQDPGADDPKPLAEPEVFHEIYIEGDTGGGTNHKVSLGGEWLGSAELAELPTEPDELKTALLAFEEARPITSWSIPELRGESGVFFPALGLVQSSIASPELRSAAFMVLSDLEGVEIETNVKDPLDRDAFAISYNRPELEPLYQASFDAYNEELEDLYFETYGEEFPGGHDYGRTSYRSQAEVKFLFDPDTTAPLGAADAESFSLITESSWEVNVPKPPADAKYSLGEIYVGCVVVDGIDTFYDPSPGQQPLVEGPFDGKCPDLESVLADIAKAVEEGT